MRRIRIIPRRLWLSFLPSRYVCRNQNFEDAGLELGEVRKTLFLDEIKRHFQSRRPVNLTNLL